MLRVTDPRSMAALDLELAELEARKAKLERLAALRVEVAAAEGRELAARFGRDQDWERFKTILLVVSGAYNVPMVQLTGVHVYGSLPGPANGGASVPPLQVQTAA